MNNNFAIRGKKKAQEEAFKARFTVPALVWRHSGIRANHLLLCWVVSLGTLSGLNCPPVAAGSIHPYYTRHIPVVQDFALFSSDTTHIDLTHAHLPSYGPSLTVAEANRLFVARAAAAISDATGIVSPKLQHELVEEKSYKGVPAFYIPTARCLAAMAYTDFFEDLREDKLRPSVSAAILASKPGWCGSFGAEVRTTVDLPDASEGNYDITQMHLIPIAYGYYDELSEQARDRLITLLLASGHINRPYLDEIFTSGGPPNDWSRAGRYDPLGGGRIGETENHILMIHTARYLSNQLLYQRDHAPDHDNRRNGGDDRPSCTSLMLALLRDMLRGDFSEYNAKPYQNETRSALLNLASYAYDHEVRLAARMVLDYVSARFAVSSCDLRRMVPFRRRNESGGGDHHHRADQLATDPGVMDVGLIDWDIGADPLSEHFAIQAGNLRAYEKSTPAWSIHSDGNDAALEALSEYRLPPSIHDLFINDLHRRFFQRLHRTPHPDEVEGGRNCDNMEIYAGSPSYLISAGGKPATFAIDPGPAKLFAPADQIQQLGVAVTTSFMPAAEWLGGAAQISAELIQFSSFSDRPDRVENYGVAPDFAFGNKIYLPNWVPKPREREFLFLDRKYPGVPNIPGYYLAIFKDGDLGCLEAYDTWMQPGLNFEQFKASVLQRNPNFHLETNKELLYVTQNGNRVHFLIEDFFDSGDTRSDVVTRIEYGNGDPWSNQGDAGNVKDKFLNGTILNSPAEAVVEISNPFLGTKIVLDMQDQWHPKRLSETGELEEGGDNHEVWLDFDWTGPTEGDFFRPFNTLSAALAGVADGGVIKIMPGSTREKPVIKKRVRLEAPIGGVKIGVF